MCIAETASFEDHFRAVVGVGTDKKTAGLSVQRKLVEPHGTNEGDVSRLTVENILLRGDPQASQFGQNSNNFVSFQVVDKDVWDPESVNELQAHGDHSVVAARVF